MNLLEDLKLERELATREVIAAAQSLVARGTLKREAKVRLRGALETFHRRERDVEVLLSGFLDRPAQTSAQAGEMSPDEQWDAMAAAAEGEGAADRAKRLRWYASRYRVEFGDVRHPVECAATRQ